MKRFVIIIDDGRIEDVLTSSKEQMEFLVADFDKKTLDQSVLSEVREPADFADVAALADIYRWEPVYDPKKVKEAFRSQDGSCLNVEFP